MRKFNSVIFLSFFLSFFLLYSCQTEEEIIDEGSGIIETRGDEGHEGHEGHIFVHHISTSDCCVTFHLLLKHSPTMVTPAFSATVEGKPVQIQHPTTSYTGGVWESITITACLPEGIPQGQSADICLTVSNTQFYSFEENDAISSDGTTVCGTTKCRDTENMCVYYFCWENIGGVDSPDLVINGTLYDNFGDFNSWAAMATAGENLSLLTGYEVTDYMDDVANCTKGGYGHTPGLFFLVPADEVPMEIYLLLTVDGEKEVKVEPMLYCFE